MTRSRGQTLPVYAMATIAVSTLIFFLFNYTNDLLWHIRAQNAADAAALSVISTDANINNKQQLIMYSLALNEFRMRAMLQSLTNAGLSDGANKFGGCDPFTDYSSQTCNQAYDVQLNQNFPAVAKNYSTLVNQLQALYNPKIPPPVPALINSPPLPTAGNGSSASSVFSIFAYHSDCTVADCGLSYTATDLTNTGFGSSEKVDILTCALITPIGGSFLGNAQPFYAIGHAAATLRPVTEDFSPGTQVNPATGVPYQPPELSAPQDREHGWTMLPAYNTDFKNVSIRLTWYLPALTTPFHPTPARGSIPCLPH